MDGNAYLTAGELSLIENHGRGYGYHDGYGYCHKGNATATTGVALGAGLGGAALVGVVITAWALNQASKARSRAAENLANANMNYINQMSALVLSERTSRENWQNANAPTIRQYVDVQAGAGSFAGAGAGSYSLAQAEANLLTGALTGQYARCPQEVTLVAKQNCGCPGGCNG